MQKETGWVWVASKPNETAEGGNYEKIREF